MEGGGEEGGGGSQAGGAVQQQAFVPTWDVENESTVPTGKSGQWPENGVYVCEEDDRCMDVGRLYGVNLDRLVQINKVRYKGLNKTCKVAKP